MKIGFLSQMAVREFQDYFPNENLPEGYPSEIFVPLVRNYLECGHEVVLCTLDLKSPVSKTFKNKNLTIFVAGTLVKAKLRAVTGFRREINEMVRFLKANPCDIYHAHWTYEFAMAALEVDPEKTLITIHDWPEEIYKILHDYYRKRRLHLSKKVFDKGKYFTTVSPYIENFFTKTYAGKSITIIPNYIKFNQSDLKYKKELSLDSPVIVSISTFDDRKNTKKLMEAFQKIREAIPGATLRLFGGGHGVDEDGYIWAKRNNLTDGIEFIGAIPHDEIMAELKKSDLLIHPSLEESFGLTLIEAMACKTPVIGGKDSGAVPWVLSYGKAGRLVDVTDTDSIANNAIDILTHFEVWNSYIEAGIIRVHDFEFETISDAYLNEYKDIISKFD